MAEIIRNDNQTIDGTSVLIADAVKSTQRRALVITNVSTGGQVIYLSWGGAAQVGFGIPLYPAGVTSEAIDSVFIPSPMRIYAIASAAGGSIAIHERLEA